ncbi:hypothetical protein TSUD_174100 [Trifolium subterraneum]|nr:hypothetical protein TSUD_174100 [Trifolium subterraneum]
MGDNLKQKLTNLIKLADNITNTADAPIPLKQECGELKSKTEELSALLPQVATVSSELYLQRPMRQILEQTEHVLNETLSLVIKCHPKNIKKTVFTIIPIAIFRKTSSKIENSINDVSGLLRISFPDEDHGHQRLIVPSIAFNDPIVASIWELIASLCIGSQEGRSEAAACLVSLALQSDRYGKMTIEEGGVGPLLMLMKEGNIEGQKNARIAIGLLKVINSVVILITSASMLCEHGS